jgi:pimeloyl-ACP methyl ester carboxylesterase
MVDKRFFEGVVAKGTAYFYVHYYGTWFSGGTFSYRSCQDSITRAVDFIRRGRGMKAFDGESFTWRAQSFSIVGCSFAGNVLLTAPLDWRGLKGVVLYAPLIFISDRDVKNFSSPEQLEAFHHFNAEFIAFLRRGYRFVVRGLSSSGIDRYFLGREAKSTVKLRSGVPHIKIFHGLDDTTVPSEASRFLQKRYPGRVSVRLVPHCGHDFTKLYEAVNR